MEQVSSTETVVFLSGSVLSSLLFKLKNSIGDSEGFLMGEVCRRSVDAITDSQSSGVREEKKIHVQSFVLFDQKFSFYDHFGVPDLEKIKKELEAQYQCIIGWFSYRRNTSQRISLRERAIHQQLIKGLSHVTRRDFVFGLVTDSLVDQTPILSTEYSFYTWDDSSYKVVGVEGVNLRGSDAVPYLTSSLSHEVSLQSSYASEAQAQSSLFLDCDSQVLQAVAIENLYKTIQQRLHPLSSQLAQSNKDIISLEEEVRRLQDLADELQQEATQKEIEEDRTLESVAVKEESNSLIDLNSPDQKIAMSLQSHIITDLPEKNSGLVESTSLDLLTEQNPALLLNTGSLLQPLLVPSNKHHNQEEDVDESFSTNILPSQELF